MITEVILPALGETMDSARIVHWYKNVGDPVEEGEILFEIETDKATIEVNATSSGFLREIVVPEDLSVPIGSLVAIISDDLKEPLPEMRSEVISPTVSEIQFSSSPDPAIIPSTSARSSDRTIASPRARRLADQSGLDISAVGQGTGPKGRIVEADVRKHLSAIKGASVNAGERSSPESEDQVFPLDGSRRQIAERMQHSFQTAPHFYLSTSVDISSFNNAREKWGQSAVSEDGGSISFTAFIVFASAWALKHHPWINASLRGEKIILFSDVNIGIAVAKQDGLIVPVLRHADRKSLIDISTELEDLIENARRGVLKLHQAQGSTFTISNLGMYGIEDFSAIINPPESAILAIGSITQKTVPLENGSIAIRPIIKVTLSCDHRVIDGVIGAAFLKDLRDVLENPALLLR